MVMRISTSLFFQRSTNAMLEQQSQLSRTQVQMATGERILTPSDDPAGSVRILGLNGAIDTIQQYQDNVDRAVARLDLEEDVIENVSNLLQRAGELAIQGNNDTLSLSDKEALAEEVRQLLNQTLYLGNTRDTNGDYIFSGYQSNTEAFTQTSLSTFVYNGDQGQRRLQISAGQQIADGDNGLDIFMGVDTGLFADVTGVAATTFGAIADGDLTINGISVGFIPPAGDATERAGQIRDAVNALVDQTHVRAEFATPDTLTLSSSAGDIVISAASLTDTGLTTATTTATAGTRSVFDTLYQLASELEADRYVDRYITDVQLALQHMSEKRAGVGARLNAIDQQKEINADIKLTLESQRSEVQDLDYAEAATEFNRELVALQAAQEAYIKVQGLSLFNFLS